MLYNIYSINKKGGTLMVKYSRPKEGYKYAITELGIKEPKIRTKYEKDTPMKLSYERCVPTKWLEMGYVEEIKDGTK